SSALSPQKRHPMPLDWKPFVDLVNHHQRFLLTTHIRPDGDGLGSMLALADSLEAHGKVVHTVVASALVPRYDFLDPKGRIQRFHLPGDAYRDSEAVIVQVETLDTTFWIDRKSTRLNSSHQIISYAVFCLKKKNQL